MPFEDFHIWENHKNRSWGIRLLMMYNLQDLEEKKAKVESILEKYSGIKILEHPETPQVDFSGMRESNFQRVMKLLELNSSLIDALYYSKGEILSKCKEISDINNAILQLRINLTDNDKVDVYNFIDVTIWEIIFDFIHDIKLGYFKPTEKELSDLEELQNTRASFLKFLNQTKMITIWGRQYL